MNPVSHLLTSSKAARRGADVLDKRSRLGSLVPSLRLHTTTSANGNAHGAAAREIYHVLRDEILTLVLEPGLPLDETSLSKRFSVSRSPVREALNRLLAERLVETLPNRSTIVA